MTQPFRLPSISNLTESIDGNRYGKVRFEGENNSLPPISSVFETAPPVNKFQLASQQQSMSPVYPTQKLHNDVSVSPQQRSGSGNSSSGKSPLKCECCGSENTPEWRRGPNGSRTLCNACGLYYAKISKKKGTLVATEEMKRKKEMRSRRNNANGVGSGVSSAGTVSVGHAGLAQGNYSTTNGMMLPQSVPQSMPHTLPPSGGYQLPPLGAAHPGYPTQHYVQQPGQYQYQYQYY